MSIDLDPQMTPSAKQLFEKIKSRFQKALKKLERYPVSVLIWGPNPESVNPLATVRLALRAQLRELGHAAVFSEELHEKGSDVSPLSQQALQLKEFDVIVSMPSSPGSIAEAHDFFGKKQVKAMILVFLNEEFKDGYDQQSLRVLTTGGRCRVEFYPNEHQTEIIFSKSIDIVRHIQEIKFLNFKDIA